MFERYSVDSVTDLMQDVIAFNEAHLADRIRRIPDGRQWEASVWLDFPRGAELELYECRLVVERRGGKLRLDLTGSSDQAAAVINCGRPGLLAGVLNALMVLVGFGLPKCPEAMLRSVEIESRPGSFVHAVHPAGCAKATTSACHAILLAFNLALSRMFGDVEEFAQRVLAGSGGFLPVIDIEGLNRSGTRFGVPLIDLSLSAGYGAMPGRDGIDSAGPLHSPFAAIANVETHEARYPLLYLWRRQEMDSGGLGTHRGGRGTAVAWTPHRATGGIGAILHGHGIAVASTPGVAGGYPGSTNTFSIVRNSGYHAQLAEGHVPARPGDLGAPAEPTSGLHMTRLTEDDVVVARNSGGGGWGDPLGRDPVRVLADVRDGAVSTEWARRGYGVVVEEDKVDAQATLELRRGMRAERALLSGFDGTALKDPAECRHAADGATVGVTARALHELGAYILPSVPDERFHALEEVCSACGALLDVRMAPGPRLLKPEA
jgi:N-methylhydantoinase B